MTAPEFNIEKLKTRVQKLLAQAESVSGTPEAEIFEAKAMELIAQYGISEAEARAGGKLEVKVEFVDVFFKGRYTDMQTRLLHRLSSTLRCESIAFSTKRGANATSMRIYGMPSHLARVQMLFDTLVPHMLKEAGKARPSFDANYGEMRVFRRSFMMGYIITVRDRLAKADRMAMVNHEAGALVLVSDREKAKKAVEEAFPNAKTTKSAAKTDAEGWVSGSVAGQKADLNTGTGVGGGSNRALN